MTEAFEQLDGFGFDQEALEREIEAIERELQEELLRELGHGFEGFGGQPAPAPPAAAPMPPTAPSSPAPTPPTLI
jgi:hypothetical protein